MPNLQRERDQPQQDPCSQNTVNRLRQPKVRSVMLPHGGVARILAMAPIPPEQRAKAADPTRLPWPAAALRGPDAERWNQVSQATMTKPMPQKGSTMLALRSGRLIEPQQRHEGEEAGQIRQQDVNHEPSGASLASAADFRG